MPATAYRKHTQTVIRSAHYSQVFFLHLCYTEEKGKGGKAYAYWNMDKAEYTPLWRSDSRKGKAGGATSRRHACAYGKEYTKLAIYGDSQSESSGWDDNPAALYRNDENSALRHSCDGWSKSYRFGWISVLWLQCRNPKHPDRSTASGTVNLLVCRGTAKGAHR